MGFVFGVVPEQVADAAIEPAIGGVGKDSDYSFDYGRKVANIYPGQIVGKNALSVYKKFDLDSGKIANLHLQIGLAITLY